ncbi:MAG: serine/threonine-protein kinase, partial [Actinomycetota bacterium]
MIPDRIGRYQVHSVLGAGGFATVFLAHDPDLEAWVAIKVLADNMARDVDFRDRFVREARVMRQLETPGLVTVYDIGDHQGAPYFVMEYCERGTLADRIDGLGRPLSPAEAYQLAGAIAACTGHIHRAGMVHRDLKPSNYLIRSRRHTAPAEVGGPVLSPDEELAVADFGLAKVIDRNASQVSIAGGTPGYSAPEQFRGDPSVDASADVYAASAMVAAAVTGRQPTPVLAPGDTAYQSAELQAAGPMAEELRRGLAVDKSLRHADINAWFTALTTTVSGATPINPTVAAPGSVPSAATSVAPTDATGPVTFDLPPPAAGAPAPAAGFGATTPVNPGPATTPGGA